MKLNKLTWTILSAIGVFVFIYWSYGVQVTAKLWDPNDGATECGSAHPISIKVRNWTVDRIVNTQVFIELWIDGKTVSVLKDFSSFKPFNIEYAVAPLSVEVFCLNDSFFDELRLAKENVPQTDNIFQSAIIETNHFMNNYVLLLTLAEIDVRLVETERR